MKHKILFILILLIANGVAYSQSIRNCRVIFSTKVLDSLYTIVTKEATLTYNVSTNELILLLQLSSLDHEIDTIENYFNQSSSQLIFKANTSVNFFDLIENESNRNKIYPINGYLLLNNKSKGLVGQYSLMLLNNDSRDNKQNLRFTLDLTFFPKDFDIDKIFPALTQPILLEIDDAIVNVNE